MGEETTVDMGNGQDSQSDHVQNTAEHGEEKRRLSSYTGWGQIPASRVPAMGTWAGDLIFPCLSVLNVEVPALPTLWNCG